MRTIREWEQALPRKATITHIHCEGIHNQVALVEGYVATMEEIDDNLMLERTTVRWDSEGHCIFLKDLHRHPEFDFHFEENLQQ